MAHLTLQLGAALVVPFGAPRREATQQPRVAPETRRRAQYTRPDWRLRALGEAEPLVPMISAVASARRLHAILARTRAADPWEV